MSYRVGSGPHAHEHDGMVLRTDRRVIDRSVLAIVVEAMRRVGLEPDDVQVATVVLDESDLHVPYVEFDIVRRRAHDDGIGMHVGYETQRVPVMRSPSMWVRRPS